MSLEDSMKEGEPCILVEGPEWGDAKFVGKWLRKAANAEALRMEAISDDDFEWQTHRLTGGVVPNFGIYAMQMVSWLLMNVGMNMSFAVQLEDVETVEGFVMMVDMGFFVLAGQRYQMAIPAQLNMTAVKRAVLKLTETEDAEYCLHSECLVVTMPYAEAKAWQARLRLLLLNTPFKEAVAS